MTSVVEARGPVATAMAEEHHAIAGLVDAASACLLLLSGAADGLVRASRAAAALRRHLTMEERLLFGRPIVLEGAYAEDHLTRDHGLIESLLSLVDEPTIDSPSLLTSPPAPLRVLVALRRLHHLLEHHDQREVEGLCAAIDGSLPHDAALSVAQALRHGVTATTNIWAGRAATRDDVHEPALRLEAAAPGPYAEVIWRVAVDGAPLVLPPKGPPHPGRHRAIDAAVATLQALLHTADGQVTMAAFDQALRVDRLVSRTAA